MRHVVKFAAVSFLGLIGFSAVGSVDTPISSPILSMAFSFVSLIGVPLYVASSRHPQRRFWVAVAAPVIAFGLGHLYWEVIDWEHFPRSMLKMRDPQFTAEDAKRFLQ